MSLNRCLNFGDWGLQWQELFLGNLHFPPSRYFSDRCLLKKVPLPFSFTNKMCTEMSLDLLSWSSQSLESFLLSPHSKGWLDDNCWVSLFQVKLSLSLHFPPRGNLWSSRSLFKILLSYCRSLLMSSPVHLKDHSSFTLLNIQMSLFYSSNMLLDENGGLSHLVEPL